MPQYSDSEFREIDTCPNENTLTLNVTHDQLSRLSSTFEKRVAIGPTRFDEGSSSDPSKPLGKGYDVTFDTAKEIVFQHKAPSNTVVRTDERGEKRQWINYSLNTKQLLALALQYNPREAYYAFPVVPEQRQLKQALTRTVFVDAFSIFLHSLADLTETSRIYVEYLPEQFSKPAPHRERRRQTPEVRGKFNDRRRRMDSDVYYELAVTTGHHGDVLFWEAIEDRIRNCSMGLPIRGIGSESFDWYSEEEPLPPGFELEFPGSLSPMYREHLRRRWAINEYASNEDRRREIESWFQESLEIRYRRAQKNEISVWAEELFEQQSVRPYIRSALEDMAKGRDPASYGLGGVRRHILERGTDLSDSSGRDRRVRV